MTNRHDDRLAQCFGDVLADVLTVLQRECPQEAAAIMEEHGERLSDVTMNQLATVPHKRQLFGVAVLDVLLTRLATHGYGLQVVKQAS